MPMRQRIVVIAVVGISVGACAGEDSCEEAYRKLEDCGIGDSGDPRACQNSDEECIAKCTVQATCEDIMDATTAGGYEQCLAACAE